MALNSRVHNIYERSQMQLLINRLSLDESVRKAATYPYTNGQRCINTDRLNNVINETLTKTYSSEKTKSYAEKQLDLLNIKGYCKIILNFAEGDDDSQIADSINVIIDGYCLNRTVYNTVVQAFELCGYFMSCEYWTPGKKEFVFQFEPLFQDVSYTKQNIPHYIYHVTKPTILHKIQRNGITPRSKNTQFNYPPRCYFFTELDEELIRWFAEDSEKVQEDQDCLVLTVDTTKLNNDVKFWEDKLFDGSVAIYTYDNIPPTAIVNYQKI